MLKRPVQHLYPLEIGCQERAATSQPEKSTGNVEISEIPSNLSQRTRIFRQLLRLPEDDLVVQLPSKHRSGYTSG